MLANRAILRIFSKQIESTLLEEATTSVLLSAIRVTSRPLPGKSAGLSTGRPHRALQNNSFVQYSVSIRNSAACSEITSCASNLRTTMPARMPPNFQSSRPYGGSDFPRRREAPCEARRGSSRPLICKHGPHERLCTGYQAFDGNDPVSLIIDCTLCRRKEPDCCYIKCGGCLIVICVHCKVDTGGFHYAEDGEQSQRMVAAIRASLRMASNSLRGPDSKPWASAMHSDYSGVQNNMLGRLRLPIGRSSESYPRW